MFYETHCSYLHICIWNDVHGIHGIYRINEMEMFINVQYMELHNIIIPQDSPALSVMLGSCSGFFV